MTDMVEATAKALCEASGETWKTGDIDAANNHWRFKARAAIKAMRDMPQDTIWKAAASIGYGPGVLEKAYHAALDAALGEAK